MDLKLQNGTMVYNASANDIKDLMSLGLLGSLGNASNRCDSEQSTNGCQGRNVSCINLAKDDTCTNTNLDYTVCGCSFEPTRYEGHW